MEYSFHGTYPYIDVVVGLATGRASQDRQVKGDDPDKNG
jgi:hypothetical protein